MITEDHHKALSTYRQVHPNSPASPMIDCSMVHLGLTKREHFAALAMQGLVVADGYYNTDWAILAIDSLKAADALIAALNNTTTTSQS